MRNLLSVNDNKVGKGTGREIPLPCWWKILFGNMKQKPLKLCPKFENYMDTLWSNNFAFKNLIRYLHWRIIYIILKTQKTQKYLQEA